MRHVSETYSDMTNLLEVFIIVAALKRRKWRATRSTFAPPFIIRCRVVVFFSFLSNFYRLFSHFRSVVRLSLLPNLLHLLPLSIVFSISPVIRRSERCSPTVVNLPATWWWFGFPCFPLFHAECSHSFSFEEHSSLSYRCVVLSSQQVDLQHQVRTRQLARSIMSLRIDPDAWLCRRCIVEATRALDGRDRARRTMEKRIPTSNSIR